MLHSHWPRWRRFRAWELAQHGLKQRDVATALGVIACLGGWATVAAAAVFGLSFACWRIVSLASILAALGFAVCQIVRLWPAQFSESHSCCMDSKTFRKKRALSVSDGSVFP